MLYTPKKKKKKKRDEIEREGRQLQPVSEFSEAALFNACVA